MKHEIREVSNGLLQITTQDERHYFDPIDKIFMPSTTWVVGHYPKGKEFYKWLATTGWDESQELMSDAGDRGTRQHAGCEMLARGGVVKYDTKFYSHKTGTEEELTTEEYAGVMSFADWFNRTQPEILEIEISVFNKPDEYFSHGYAGSVDLICRIGGQIWVIDLKTSKQVFESHKIQLSAYKHIIEKKYPGEIIKTAVLQIGFAKNKRHWKFTECEDKFHLFKVAYQIWEEEVKYKDVQQKDYPLEIRLESKPIEDVDIVIPKAKPKKAKATAKKANKTKLKK